MTIKVFTIYFSGLIFTLPPIYPVLQTHSFSLDNPFTSAPLAFEGKIFLSHWNYSSSFSLFLWRPPQCGSFSVITFLNWIEAPRFNFPSVEFLWLLLALYLIWRIMCYLGLFITFLCVSCYLNKSVNLLRQGIVS